MSEIYDVRDAYIDQMEESLDKIRRILASARSFSEAYYSIQSVLKEVE